MATEHIEIMPVRAYLLGILDPTEASALEDRYFRDDRLFGEVQAVETYLIRDYLDGRLSTVERGQFEGRYLRIPALQDRVRQVRSEYSPQTASGRPSWAGSWRLATALLIVLCVGAASWIAIKRSGPQPPLVARLESPVLPGVLTIRLTPGLSKGAPAGAFQFGLPSQGDIRFVFELPGVTSPVEASARIRTVGSTGEWTTVWKSPAAVRSTPTPIGQDVAIVLNASLFAHNDYVVDLSASPDIRETYVFRLTALR